MELEQSGAEPAVDDHFDTEGALDPRWTIRRPGGRVEIVGSALRFALNGARAGVYSDAQIDDYTTTTPATFRWRPPVRMAVRARASHPAPAPPASTPASPPDTRGESEGQRHLVGTFGFGFWNAPASLRRVPRLPAAVWFFGASQPSNMALVPGVAGWGWKAQVVHANRPGMALTGASAVGAALWARLSGDPLAYAQAERWTQRATGAYEAQLSPLADLREWREYTLEWRRNVARFWVNDTEVLAAPSPPQGPLGFIAWLDNQYAIATPRGELRFGTLSSGPQWLELDYLRITPL